MSDLKIEIIVNYGPRISSPRNSNWNLAHCSCKECVNPKLNNEDHLQILKNLATSYGLKMKTSPQGICVPNSHIKSFISSLKKHSISYTFLKSNNQSPREKSPSRLKFEMENFFSTHI